MAQQPAEHLTDGRYEGERILWSGRPVRLPALVRGTTLLVVVGVAVAGWCGYRLTRLVGGLLDDTGSDAFGRDLAFVGFVIIGVVALVGFTVLLRAYVLLARWARAFHYLVTERRLVVTSGGLAGPETRTVPLAELGRPEVRTRRGTHVGTVRFPDRRLRLVQIPRARQVADLIGARANPNANDAPVGAGDSG